MKKLIIILVAIMLNAAIGFAQEKTQTTTTASEQNTATQQAHLKEKNSIDAKEHIDTELAKLKSALSLLCIVICVLLALLFILFVIVILDRKNRKNIVIRTVTQSIRIKAWRDEIKIDPKQIQSNISPVRSYGCEIEDLRDRIAKLEYEKKISIDIQQTEPRNLSSERVSYTLYAPSINNSNAFSRTTKDEKDDSVFKLLLKSENDKNIKFTICEGANSRVLGNARLISGCEIHRNADNPTRLKITEGEAQLQDNVWAIIKQLVVEFV